MRVMRGVALPSIVCVRSMPTAQVHTDGTHPSLFTPSAFNHCQLKNFVRGSLPIMGLSHDGRIGLDIPSDRLFFL